MASIYADFDTDQGASFSATLNVTDSESGSSDLTGYSVAGQFKRSYTSETYTELNCELTDASIGQVTISLEPDVTVATAARKYLYDIFLTSPSGKVSKIIEGILTIYPSVTRL